MHRVGSTSTISLASMAMPAAFLVVSAEAAGTAVEAIEVEEARDDAARGSARRHRRGHATTALPYFSFAQGLRQVTGS